MKSIIVSLLAILMAQGCVTSQPAADQARPVEDALNRAWARVAAMEADQPALAGFSGTRPDFTPDEAGLVKAQLAFAGNATPGGKGAPAAVDKAKPYCYLVVSIWRPNNLPGQPVVTQRKYKIGTVELEGFVTVFCSDERLAQELRVIFEAELQKAEGHKKSEPSTPPQW